MNLAQPHSLDPSQRPLPPSRRSPVHAADARAHESLVADMQIALVAFLAAYVATHRGLLPAVYYLPLDCLWTMTPPSGIIRMKFFGIMLNGFGALVGSLLLARVLKFGERAIEAGFTKPIGRVSLVAFVATFVYFAIAETTHWMGR